MMELAESRFERRLSEQIGALRLECRSALNELRQDIAAVRQDLASTRAELIKWSFVFWIGQVAVTAGLVVAMFNLMRR